MNSQRQGEEVYFDECEPEVQQSSIALEIDLAKQQNRYGSCFLTRNRPRTPHQYKQLRMNDFKTRRNSVTISIAKENPRNNNSKRNFIEVSTSPPKKESSTRKVHPGSSTPSPYRTISITKKQTFQTISVSPDRFPKHQRQSESLTRKNLYWQSYLLEGKGWMKGNLSTNASGIMTKTLKIQREPVPFLSASSFIAMMGDSQEILLQKNKDERRQIASLTKIMTAYTVIKICNTFNIKIRAHKIAIHQQASWMGGTTANLKTDEQFLIIDLLYGLLLPSGNDAGVALAQYFGKFLSFKLTKQQAQLDESTSLERFALYKDYYDAEYQRDSIKLFVFEMNKNCFEIGLKNTQFANPTGLSNSKNYSTARDMALLTSHCLRNNLLREIFKKKVYTCEAVNEKMAYTRQVQWRNTNRHLYQFRECIGVKTGITPTAGPCLSSAYKVMNRQIVVVVLNSTSIENRYEDARLIYKWCRSNMRVAC